MPHSEVEPPFELELSIQPLSAPARNTDWSMLPYSVTLDWAKEAVAASVANAATKQQSKQIFYRLKNTKNNSLELIQKIFFLS